MDTDPEAGANKNGPILRCNIGIGGQLAMGKRFIPLSF
jgi:hypothetical protein